jgi:hypothetical protein
MSEPANSNFDVDKLRKRLWNAIAYCAVDIANPNAAATVDRIFDDITNVIRQRTGWTLNECELLFADAKNRAECALNQAEEDDALLVKVRDAVDVIVELLTEKEQP